MFANSERVIMKPHSNEIQTCLFLAL